MHRSWALEVPVTAGAAQIFATSWRPFWQTPLPEALTFIADETRPALATVCSHRRVNNAFAVARTYLLVAGVVLAVST